MRDLSDFVFYPFVLEQDYAVLYFTLLQVDPEELGNR